MPNLKVIQRSRSDYVCDECGNEIHRGDTYFRRFKNRTWGPLCEPHGYAIPKGAQVRPSATEDGPRHVSGAPPAGTQRINVGNVEMVLEVNASLSIETTADGLRVRVHDGAKVS